MSRRSADAKSPEAEGIIEKREDVLWAGMCSARSGTRWLLGLLADQTSLTTVMIVIAALPLPGFLISLALPGENEAGQPSEEPARV